MSDTWNDIQVVKHKTTSLRDKIAKRRQEREGILANISKISAPTPPPIPQGAGNISFNPELFIG